VKWQEPKKEVAARSHKVYNQDKESRCLMPMQKRKHCRYITIEWHNWIHIFFKLQKPLCSGNREILL
jgi:hypothetical protein